MNLSAKGQNGTTVSFDGRFVTITRGMMSGQGRGEKRIATGSINAVQFKKAGKLGRGFISFTVGGGDEKASKIGGQIQSAWKDENSAVFLSTSNADFEAIRDAVEAAMTAPTASPTASSGADEIAKLAELHAQGVLSDEEFTAAKMKALGI